MNTKQKLSAIYLYKVSQGAEQHTKRLFLAWHSSVWHKPETKALNIFLNAHLDRVSTRCVHMSVLIVPSQTCLCLEEDLCTCLCSCLSVHAHGLAMLNQYGCACVCDWVCGWVWRAASPSSTESTEVQADPVSHKINLPRAILTSLSVSLPFSHSVIPCPSSPPCLWLKEWAVLQQYIDSLKTTQHTVYLLLHAST